MKLKHGLVLPLIILAGVATTHVPVRTVADRATVSVTNENPLDVDVFASAGQNRIRLGTVVTGQTQVFDLPVTALSAGQVRIVVAPVGARDSFVSEPLSVADGDQIKV